MYISLKLSSGKTGIYVYMAFSVKRMQSVFVFYFTVWMIGTF